MQAAQPLSPGPVSDGGTHQIGDPADLKIIAVICGRLSDGTEIVGAADGVGCRSGTVQRRQQHSGEDRDDRDHNQQLYQCEIITAELKFSQPAVFLFLSQ